MVLRRLYGHSDAGSNGRLKERTPWGVS